MCLFKILKTLNLKNTQINIPLTVEPNNPQSFSLYIIWAFIVAIICLSVFLFIFRKRKRNGESRQILPEDSMYNPNYPILGDAEKPSLRDIIEMTTSGSGSGK